MASVGTYKPSVTYPSTSFGQALQAVAEGGDIAQRPLEGHARLPDRRDGVVGYPGGQSLEEHLGTCAPHLPGHGHRGGLDDPSGGADHLRSGVQAVARPFSHRSGTVFRSWRTAA